MPSRGCARGNARAPRGRGAVAPPRIALASRGFRRARRAEIPPRASRRARGARARSRARARQEKEDDSPEIETARPAPHERRTPSRRARDGGRDGVEKGTRAGSRARTSTRRRERAAGGFQWAFARAPRRFSHRPSRAFLPSGPPRPTHRSRPPAFAVSDRPTRSGPGGGVPSPLPVAEDAPAPAVRPRRRPTSSPGARARVHPRERASRASSTTVARPARETHPEQAPTLDRGGARARARRVVADRRARRDATVVRGEGCGHHGAKGGRGARGFVWDGEVRRGGGVPLVRIRRALTDPRNTCWSKHNINPEIAGIGTLKQIVTVARRTPSLSAMMVRICATYYVRVGSNIKGTDGLVVE